MFETRKNGTKKIFDTGNIREEKIAGITQNVKIQERNSLDEKM